MPINPQALKPAELMRLLNTTDLGTVRTTSGRSAIAGVDGIR
jgi:hypothetical protein